MEASEKAQATNAGAFFCRPAKRLPVDSDERWGTAKTSAQQSALRKCMMGFENECSFFLSYNFAIRLCARRICGIMDTDLGQ